MKNNKMTKALKTLEKKPLKYKEFQQVIWNINGNDGIVSQGYYCTNINTIKGNGLIVKKGNKYHLTTIGKNNINAPYSMPKEMLKKEVSKWYNLHCDDYHTIRHLKTEITELKSDNDFLRLQLETAQDLLIGCAKDELLKVIESEEFNSKLLEYLID